MIIRAKISERGSTKRFVDLMNQVSDGAITFTSYFETENSGYDFGICVDDDRGDLQNTICILFEGVNHQPQKWMQFDAWSKNHAYVLNWNRKITSQNSIYCPYQFWFIEWERDLFDYKLDPVIYTQTPRDYILSFAGANKQAYAVARDLYSERRNFLDEAVKHFRPSEFRIYGNGWEKYNGYFRGSVEMKSETVRGAKVSFCTENQTDDLFCYGYATEKIFDAMRNGAVPIYAGAPDITEFVPEDCFYRYDRIERIDHSPASYSPGDMIALIKDDLDEIAGVGIDLRYDAMMEFLHSPAYRRLIHPETLYGILVEKLPH